MKIEVEGLDKLSAAADRIGLLLSPKVLEAEVMRLSREAGKALHAASVRACMESIYDMPEMTYDRTMALLYAHRLTEISGQAVGIFFTEQTIDIDPEAEAQIDQHPGRELVIDYAGYVHDGYTQWVWGINSGQFVPGKFWFDVAKEEAYPVVYAYIKLAFENLVSEIMREVIA